MIRDRDPILKTVSICQFASKIQKNYFGHIKLVNEQKKIQKSIFRRYFFKKI